MQVLHLVMQCTTDLYSIKRVDPCNVFTYHIICYSITKDFPKERYNTYAKSCNSNFYTKYPGATYSGLSG